MDRCRDFGIMIVSSLCQGGAVLPFTKSNMTSLVVSDTAQNKGGNSHHQICNAIRLVIQVKHWLQGGRIRSSTPGYVRQPGAKIRQWCQSWWLGKGSLGHNYLPWDILVILELIPDGPFIVVVLFWQWHHLPMKDIFHWHEDRRIYQGWYDTYGSCGVCRLQGRIWAWEEGDP